jgi:hypothetical protein
MSANVKDGLYAAQMGGAHSLERRETRYSLAIEIWVEGIDANGGIFHFGAVTRDVSEWGCSFSASTEIDVDDIVSIKLRESSKGRADSGAPTLFQVVRVKRENRGWLIGSWRLNDEGPWSAEIERRIAELPPSACAASRATALRANRRDRADGE